MPRVADIVITVQVEPQPSVRWDNGIRTETPKHPAAAVQIVINGAELYALAAKAVRNTGRRAKNGAIRATVLRTGA